MTEQERVRDICEHALATIGYHLVEVELVREAQGCVLRVFVDHPPAEGLARDVTPKRINHDDCTKVSRHLSAVLDVEDPISEAYHLEVSSPGVYRPLREPRDFARFAGFAVKVRLQNGLDGRRNFSGVLEGVDEGDVLVDVEGQSFRLPIRSIFKAELAEPY